MNTDELPAVARTKLQRTLAKLPLGWQVARIEPMSADTGASFTVRVVDTTGVQAAEMLVWGSRKEPGKHEKLVLDNEEKRVALMCKQAREMGLEDNMMRLLKAFVGEE